MPNKQTTAHIESKLLDICRKWNKLADLNKQTAQQLYLLNTQIRELCTLNNIPHPETVVKL